jgi:hypothetical protein
MKADFEGWLEKKGDKGPIKLFAKRYFRLYKNENLLCYFKTDKNFKQLGAISLTGILLCEKTKEKTGFNIVMKTSARVYRLQAKDDATRTTWMDKVQPFIKSYSAPPQLGKARKKKSAALYPIRFVQYFSEIEGSKSIRYSPHDISQGAAWTPEDGQNFLYLNGDSLATVHEVRQVSLDGEKSVWIENLPKTLKDTQDTINAHSLTDAHTYTVHQTFYKDDKVEAELLKKLVGKTISVSVPRRDAFPDPVTFKGELIYDLHEGRYALYDKEGDNSVHFINIGEPISYHLLENNKAEPILLNKAQKQTLFYEPSLHLKMETANPDHLLELSYNIKDSFEWHVAYNAVLNHTENTMELVSYVDIKNKSGKHFDNAQVMLISNPQSAAKKEELEKDQSLTDKAKDAGKDAGEKKAKGMLGGLGGALSLLGGGAEEAPEPPRPKLFTYHVPQPITLINDHRKQVKYIQSNKVAVNSFDLVRFDTPDYAIKPKIGKDDGANVKGNVDTVIEFVNTQENGLGLPLPGGSFNVLRREKSGFGVQQVGQASIGHYEPNYIVTVPLESLEHVKATRKQTGFNLDKEKFYMVETFDITIVNGRMVPIDLVVEESMYRWQTFEITQTNVPLVPHAHPRKVSWRVHLDAYEDTTISYTVFYNQFYCD